MDFFRKLFDASDFIPRASCGDWPSWMIAAYVTCQIVFGIAYAIIPAAMFLFWRQKRHAIPYPSVQLLFVAFISLCGLSHWLDAAMFYWPAYRVLLVVLVLGAIVSGGTAAVFPFVARYTARMKTPQEYWQLLQRINEDIHREKDVCVRLENLIITLKGREAFLLQEIDRGNAKEEAVRVDQVRQLIKNAEDTRRMLAKECDSTAA